MPYSCDRFQTMSAPQLAALLTRYVTRVRTVMIDPEAGPAVKLAEIERYTDTVIAPPPGPEATGTGETAPSAVTRSPVPVTS